MSDDSHKAKMKTWWTGSSAIVEIHLMGGYKLKDKHGHSLKSNFPTKQIRCYYQDMKV